MKRVIISDIHGDFKSFKDIYDLESPDFLILLGDYVDTHEESISSEDIKECFFNILKVREEHEKINPGSFIMLFGNHDFHYLISDPREKYSQYDYSTYKWAHEEFKNCYIKNIIKWVYLDYENKIIFSHAGVSNTWMKETCRLPISRPHGLVSLDEINKPGNLSFFKFEYLIGPYNSNGDTVYNSPIWIRPISLLSDMYKDNEGYTWKQVVGHTKMIVEPFWIENKLLILDNIKRYYLVQEIENNKIIKEEIKLLR